MYSVLIALHNILRWVVLILAIVALVRAYSGWLGRRPWTRSDRLSGLLFTITLDIQVLLGLILYFGLGWFNTLTGGNLMNLPQEPRFFAMEHILIMILAMITGHVGTLLSRRAGNDLLRHKRAAIWFTLTTLLVLVGIPWWRPLFPGLG
jgi:hypothetical protein